jgi:hypothetical protein
MSFAPVAETFTIMHRPTIAPAVSSISPFHCMSWRVALRLSFDMAQPPTLAAMHASAAQLHFQLELQAPVHTLSRHH